MGPPEVNTEVDPLGSEHGSGPPEVTWKWIPPEETTEVDPPRSEHGSGPPLDGPAGVPPPWMDQLRLSISKQAVGLRLKGCLVWSTFLVVWCTVSTTCMWLF